jgi:RNA polymerase sigma-70 factor, ECF subfamily
LESEKKIPVSLDKSTFEQLFKTLFPCLVHFARKYVYDIDTAKEITHDVFFNLWEKRENIDSSTSLKSYLFTSVYNRCMNYIRDQKKFNRDEQVFNRVEQEENIALHDHLEEQELESRIIESLNNLPPRCREIFMLSRFEGIKYAEIAEKMDISVKTVETQISKALRILREKLADYLKILIIFIFCCIH